MQVSGFGYRSDCDTSRALRNAPLAFLRSVLSSKQAGGGGETEITEMHVNRLGNEDSSSTREKPAVSAGNGAKNGAGRPV